MTLSEDVEFAVLGQQLDLHALPRVLPGLFQQVLLQPVQASLRRSHQILHRWIAVAHFGQHGLGRHAAIHDPDPPRLAVLLLDLAQEHPQCLAVGGVAGQYLVSQRQAIGRDHQRDDHLRAVRPLVATVTMASLAAFWQVRCGDLEVGAGQIVQQHVEVGVEQIAPAPDQMREQRFLVLEQQIVAGIKLVLFRQSEVRTQKIGHRAVAEPLPV